MTEDNFEGAEMIATTSTGQEVTFTEMSEAFAMASDISGGLNTWPAYTRKKDGAALMFINMLDKLGPHMLPQGDLEVVRAGFMDVLADALWNESGDDPDKAQKSMQQAVWRLRTRLEGDGLDHKKLGLTTAKGAKISL
ncbi:hypothetical protein GS636_06660 [Ruegeria sp. HKCCD4884]|uniref:hypothetical protein n=1 Tax=Ruegeria sp. HKCCD4884 TaxID=2683022 RepID=UPI0014923518|nr:hypothetical protein [Ruegeria sp. HKCCD4884]NOD92462.1 hypothetical protein [Ruegeria sp. HKCCD4884]